VPGILAQVREAITELHLEPSGGGAATERPAGRVAETVAGGPLPADSLMGTRQA